MIFPALALVALLPSLHAREVASGQPLTYADALRLALEENPTLRSAEAGVDGAHGTLVSARGAFDPALVLEGGRESSTSEGFTQLGEVYAETGSLSWGGSLSQALPTGTTWSLGLDASRRSYLYRLVEAGMTWEPELPQYTSTLALTVTQSLLEGHRLAWNLQQVREARRWLEQAEAEAIATRLQVLADTAGAYWSLRYQRDLEEIAVEALAVAEEEARVVEAMVAAGQLAPVETSRVRAAVVQARSALLEAENAHRAASDALAALLGRAPEGLLLAVSSPDEPTFLELDEARVVEAALAGNPELAVTRTALEGARDGLANARHARLPQLDLTGSAGVMGYETSQAGAFGELADATLPFWDVGVAFSVPLGNRADRGSFDAAVAALEQAEASLAAQEQALTVQVRSQLRTLRAGRQKLELARANLELAETTLAAEKALQREGRAIQKDVLEAQRALGDARAQVVQARTEHAVALVELGRLQGRLVEVAAGGAP